MGRCAGLLGLAMMVTQSAAATPALELPIAVHKLKNGLTVIVSEDHSRPLFGFALLVGVGWRLEPQGRAGFAHLFEHYMFEGTPAARRGTYDRVVVQAGGTDTAFTTYDYTVYLVEGPTAVLDRVLWLDADRMRTLDFSQKSFDPTRQGVRDEMEELLQNAPYGGFNWNGLYGKAFDRYPNNHDVGMLADLDAATLEDVKEFHRRYYVPANMVLVVTGDVQARDLFARVERAFGALPARPLPARPDVSEPVQKDERRFTEPERFAPLPAVAIGYRLPPATDPASTAGILALAVLHEGDSSRLHRRLVEKGLATGLDNGYGDGGMDYDGPSLMTSTLYVAAGKTADQALAAYDEVIGELAANGPTAEELLRARNSVLSQWYGELESPMMRAARIGRSWLYRGSADKVTMYPEALSKVTAADVQAFAKKVLVPRNRTVLVRQPSPESR